MKPVYSAIEQTDKLPLIDQPLLYVNPGEIIFTYDKSAEFLKTLDRDVSRYILLDLAFKNSSSNPRFNSSNYFYNIVPNKKINILPTFNSSLETTELIDKRSIELQEQCQKYNKTYLFWSGGIDSTLILSAILKNWNDFSNLIIVLNSKSIDEYPEMYYKYIAGKLDIIDTDLFFDKKIKFSHDNLYISGNMGDCIASFVGYQGFKKMFPNIANKSWKTNFKSIIDYYNHNNVAKNGKYAASQVIESFIQLPVQPVTVFDFLWWMEFNWAWDIDLYIFLWSFHDIDYPLDMKRFVEDNIFLYFNTVDFQNWAVNLMGTNLAIHNEISKYPFKKYIYDFNHDENYFKYKEKEFSVSKNLQLTRNKKIMAVDTDFNLYYRQNYEYKLY